MYTLASCLLDADRLLMCFFLAIKYDTVGLVQALLMIFALIKSYS